MDNDGNSTDLLHLGLTAPEIEETPELVELFILSELT
jgi:hypothetical protein